VSGGSSVSLLIALGVFCSAVALDFAAARYNLALRSGRAEHAARWSVVMCALSSVALLAFVDVSRWMLLPEFAGLYLGTLLGTRLTLDRDSAT